MNRNNKLETILALLYFTCSSVFCVHCVFQFTPRGSIWASEWCKLCSNVAKRLEDTAIESLSICCLVTLEV